MTTENPYAAPTADLTAPVEKVRADVFKRIKNAWVAALIYAGITLVVTLMAVLRTAPMFFSAWELIDVVLILGLAFGIYKKSRSCAVLMFVYFVVSSILGLVEPGGGSSFLLLLVFGYFYWQGVSGTFAYHKAIKS
jgi:lysylphosphatidylglycerol synthetase-like protein (DUF2156 family)